MRPVNDIENIIEVAEKCLQYNTLIEKANQIDLPPPVDLENAMNYCLQQRHEFEMRLRDVPDLRPGTVYPILQECKRWQRLSDAIAEYLDSAC